MVAIPLRNIEGKYEILEKLREGGMGAIYKVRHLVLDEVRVIKVMRQQLVNDEELKGRFLREARLATKIRHRNIAQLYDCTVDDEDGTAFIVMEFIDGLTLEDVLKSAGPPRLGLALEIAQQSLRALGFLHSKGMIHRDISPDNLMLTEDPDGGPMIKLIDLGIAKSLAGGEGQRTATGMFLGKVRYAAPEQFGMEGSPEMDARGDLYSFGLVLYELLTGRYPIQGKDPNSIIAGHLFRPPLDMGEADPGGRIPPGLRQVVLSALAKRPEERPSSAQELARALAPYRSPSDCTHADLQRALSRSTGETGAFALRTAGSTQQRLNEQFGMGITPTPAPALTLVPPPEPKTVPQGEVVPQDEGQRAREIAAALAEIEGALERGDYRAAEALLYGAEAGFGTLEAFPALHNRLAEVRQRDLESKAAARIEEAERRPAEPASPASPEIEEVPAVTPEQKKEARRAERLAAAAADIRQRLENGDLEEAGGLLDRSIVTFGAVEALREQWQHLEALRLQARADREAEARKPFVAMRAEPEPARLGKSVLQAPPASDETRATVLPEGIREKPPVAQSASPSVEVPVFQIGEPRSAASRRLRVAVAIAILLILIAVGWRMIRKSPATLVPIGTLVVDAIPWGEVTEIVDGDGKKHSVEPKSYTPLVLSLPVGRYTVTLKNPGYPPVSLQAEVVAGMRQESTAQFGSVDADEFFKGLGWAK